MLEEELHVWLVVTLESLNADDGATHLHELVAVAWAKLFDILRDDGAIRRPILGIAASEHERESESQARHLSQVYALARNARKLLGM
jgi:hypothetical protein